MQSRSVSHLLIASLAMCARYNLCCHQTILGEWLVMSPVWLFKQADCEACDVICVAIDAGKV